MTSISQLLTTFNIALTLAFTLALAFTLPLLISLALSHFLPLRLALPLSVTLALPLARVLAFAQVCLPSGHNKSWLPISHFAIHVCLVFINRFLCDEASGRVSIKLR